MPRPTADVTVGDEITVYYYTGQRADTAEVVKATKVWITAQSKTFPRSDPYRFRLDDQTDGAKSYPRSFCTLDQVEYDQRTIEAAQTLRSHGLVEDFGNRPSDDLLIALAAFLTAWQTEPNTETDPR